MTNPKADEQGQLIEKSTVINVISLHTMNATGV